MPRRTLATTLTLLLGTGLALLADAATLEVPGHHARITDAVTAAQPGDTVRVGTGTYSGTANGESFPILVTTQDLCLIGDGMGLSVVDAESTATVIETQADGVVIRGFTVTGGNADFGGGIRVQAGDAEIAECLITDNVAATRGSGIYVTSGADPWIHHNVVWDNRDSDVGCCGDPHGIQITNADGVVEHNLIGRHNSNGILNEGTSSPTVRNNIIYENGIEGLRGRGFCALGDSTTVISHNLFWGNIIAPILIFVGPAPEDLSSAEANDISLTDDVYGNLDGDPLFTNADGGDWSLTSMSPAIDAGDPTSPKDPDSTTADIGPFYYPQSTVSTPLPALPSGVHLSPAWPNPTAGATRITLTIATPQTVRAEIVDARGRLVRELFRGTVEPGEHRLEWNGRVRDEAPARAGVYFIRVQSPQGTDAQPVVLLR